MTGRSREARAPGEALERALPWLAAAFALALFLALVPAAPGIGDSAELTLALALAGLPHPTGYPLYVLLGHPFVVALHATGTSWVVAANAWSAFGAAVAIGLLVALTQRLVGTFERSQGRSVAIAAVLAPAVVLAVHPVWITAATQAEVYSWWFAWIAGAALLAHGIVRRLEFGPAADLAAPEGAARRSSLRRDACGWGLVCGLGLAHHLLATFHVAALTAAIVIVAVRAGRWRPSLLGWAGLGAAPALASYGFVLWRSHHPAAFQWPIEPGIGPAIAHLRGAAYAQYVGRGFDPTPWQASLLVQTIVPLVLPGVLVAGWLAWRMRTVGARLWAGAILAATIGSAGFVVRYGVPDPLMYFVPGVMVAAVLAAPLAIGLGRRVRPAMALAALAAVAVTAVSMSGRWVLVEHRRIRGADMTVRIAWASLPRSGALVLWKDDHWARLRIFQLLEGDRPGLDVVNPNRLTWSVDRAWFIRRYGIDPLEGTGGVVESIGPGLRARLGIPVVDFPEVIERTRARRRDVTRAAVSQ